jgi:pimeloyl-ACP methyl ester carboxylesterase
MSATSKQSQHSITGYAPINGLKMYYEIHGQGKAMVLIHGGGSTIQTTFGITLPLFARHYRVIAVELQAHGHTSDRNTEESFQQDAADVVALLEFLKIDQAHFVGFSNGGQTAMQIAISYPAVVDKLVLISSFYKREGTVPGFFDGLQAATLDNMPAALKTAYLHITNDQSGLQAMFNKDRNRMLHFKDWTDSEINSIHTPTLVIAGDHDVVTPQHATEMCRMISNARLMILPGNHGSFIGEACTAEEGSKMPEVTVAIIEDFLNQQ